MSLVPIQKRTAMECYIADRARDPRPPVTIGDELKRRFRILNVRTGVPGKYAAILLPKSGGFEVITRVPAQQQRNLRYVLAHECAHTYFYRFASEKAIPVHHRDTLEEPLCNLGARELLLPQRQLGALVRSDVALVDILSIARRYDALPQWVATRFLVDRPIVDGWFCMYMEHNGRMSKLPNSEVSSSSLALDLKMQASVRKLAKGHIGSLSLRLECVHLSSDARAYDCSIEFCRDSNMLDGVPVSLAVLVKLRK